MTCKLIGGPSEDDLVYQAVLCSEIIIHNPSSRWPEEGAKVHRYIDAGVVNEDEERIFIWVGPVTTTS